MDLWKHIVLVLVYNEHSAERNKCLAYLTRIYLSGLLGQVEWDTLAHFGGQLSENLGLKTTDHGLAEPLVQILQVGRPATVPLPATSKIPGRERGRERESEGEREREAESPAADAFLFLNTHISNREQLPKKTYLFTAMP